MPAFFRFVNENNLKFAEPKGIGTSQSCSRLLVVRVVLACASRIARAQLRDALDPFRHHGAPGPDLVIDVAELAHAGQRHFRAGYHYHVVDDVALEPQHQRYGTTETSNSTSFIVVSPPSLLTHFGLNSRQK